MMTTCQLCGGEEYGGHAITCRYYEPPEPDPQEPDPQEPDLSDVIGAAELLEAAAAAGGPNRAELLEAAAELRRQERTRLEAARVSEVLAARAAGAIRATATCGECGRIFDLLNETEAAEWSFGHDCEGAER